MEIGLGVMRNMNKIKIENEDRLTFNAIVEMSVIPNIDDVVSTFGLDRERVSMEKLGYIYNGREESVVSKKRKIGDVEVVTIDDNNDKVKRVDDDDERIKKKRKKNVTRAKKRNAISNCRDLNLQLDKVLSTFTNTEKVDISESDRVKEIRRLDELMIELRTMHTKQKVSSIGKHQKNIQGKNSKKIITIQQSSKSSSSNNSSIASDNKSSTSSVSNPSSKKSLTVVKRLNVSSNVSDSQDQNPLLSIALNCSGNSRSVSEGVDSDVLGPFMAT